jgi:hypothetical protein
VAGRFRFRRKDAAGSTPGGSTGDIVPTGRKSRGGYDPDAGIPTDDGELHWVGEDAAAHAESAIADGPDRSDPSVAASEGVWEVIRPAAIVPEHAARRVLVELARRDLSNGGDWQSEPQLWSRFDGPLTGDGSSPPELMGTIHVTYGTPTKYEITLYRVSVTAAGLAAGWTVASLTDEALRFGGLTLAECPRATVNPPPRPYTF